MPSITPSRDKSVVKNAVKVQQCRQECRQGKIMASRVPSQEKSAVKRTVSRQIYLLQKCLTYPSLLSTSAAPNSLGLCRRKALEKNKKTQAQDAVHREHDKCVHYVWRRWGGGCRCYWEGRNGAERMARKMAPAAQPAAQAKKTYQVTKNHRTKEPQECKSTKPHKHRPQTINYTTTGTDRSHR